MKGEDSRRLFFALWPDAHTRLAIRRATREAVRRAGGRPVPPANYHLTLAFLGEQPAGLLPAIRAAAAGCAPPKGELRLERIGYFARTRVLWLGPSRTPPTLRSAAHALWEALAPLGLRTERRAFAAHLSLARKAGRMPEVSIRPVSWRYTGFALVESETASSGARYSVLAEWPAAGDGLEEAVK